MTLNRHEDKLAERDWRTMLLSNIDTAITESMHRLEDNKPVQAYVRLQYMQARMVDLAVELGFQLQRGDMINELSECIPLEEEPKEVCEE